MLSFFSLAGETAPVKMPGALGRTMMIVNRADRLYQARRIAPHPLAPGADVKMSVKYFKRFYFHS